MKRFSGLIFCIFALLLTSCASSKNLDAGLLSDKPCKAPCWNNLTPGKSTDADVSHFTYQVGDDFPVRSLYQETPSCKKVQIQDQPGLVIHAAAVLTIEDGVLTFIESIPYYPTTLQDVTAHLGPPEYYHAVLAEGDAGPLYDVELYYPSQGLAFLVATSPSQAGSISPDMLVSRIHYFAPGSLRSYFMRWMSCSASPADALAYARAQIAKYVQPWTGFGKVKYVHE